MPFAEVTDDQAFLKAGFIGLNGSGKTYTAAQLAIGVHKRLVASNIMKPDIPVFMIDTETGRKWLKPLFDKEGIKFHASNEVSFRSLLKNMDLVAEVNGILIIDSITHFWRELCDAYAESLNRKNLRMDDWMVVKNYWQQFTKRYVHQPSHVIMCGRQGYEYEIGENDDGKRVVERSGIKMKSESETGYEPSLLIAMERHEKLDLGGRVEKVWREAYVLKDRGFTIDGKSFENPTYEDFKPHIDLLNLGGEQAKVNFEDSSKSMFPGVSSFTHHNESQACKILNEEIWGLLNKHISGGSSSDRADRLDKLEKYFNTRSATKLENLGYMELKHGYNKLHNELEGRPAFDDLPLEGGTMLEKEAGSAF